MTAKTDRPNIPHDAYADAVIGEYQRRGDHFGVSQPISVFFGGGTPSLWSPEALGRVVREVTGREAEPEVTVECNPSSLTRDHAAALRDQGVTRLSVGVQSLRESHLKFLGRYHDGAMAKRAVTDALRVFERVSADLIFGMPAHTTEELRQDITALHDLGVQHFSTYSLTVEPNTQFGALHKKGRLPLASEQTFGDLFEGAADTLGGLGFEHYEVSNHARPGHQSVHNGHYWRGGDYLGLGVGAVGCHTVEVGRAVRTTNTPSAGTYLAGPHEPHLEALGPTELERESFMLGLRTSRGVHLHEVATRSGRDPLGSRARAVDRMLSLGNLTLADGIMRIPRERWLHSDGIISSIF